MLLFVHHTANWLDATSWLLLLGGLLGGLLRAALGQGQIWRRRTLLDVVTGGAFAVLVPQLVKYFGSLDLVGPPLFWVAGGMMIGLFGNYVLVAVLWRFGVFKADPRATGLTTNGENPPTRTP